MSNYIASSWGRTRSPKNIAGTNGTAITVLANTNTLKGITASTAGYLTENQRYLHVLVEETNDGGDTDADAVSIYGYCHAFERWFEIPQSFTPDEQTQGLQSRLLIRLTVAQRLLIMCLLPESTEFIK